MADRRRTHGFIILTACVGWLTVSIGSASAADTAINFDDVSGDPPTQITNQYAAKSVTFGSDPLDGFAVAPSAYADVNARSAPNLLFIGTGSCEACTRHSDVYGTFSTPQQHMTVYAGDPFDTGSVSSRTIELDALDSMGNVIDSNTATLAKGEKVEKALTVQLATASIVHFRVRDLPASGTRTPGMALDDLSFGTTSGSGSLSGTEGLQFSGVVAHLSGANPGAVNISWGDQTAPTAGAVTQSGSGYDVSGAHTYEEEGAYSVVVKNGGGTTLATSAMSVIDAPLIHPASDDRSVYASFGNVDPDATLAGFKDRDPHASSNDYHATIDWGDGTPQTAGSVGGTRRLFEVVSDGHHYPENKEKDPKHYPVTVAIRDRGGASLVVHSEAVVPSSAPGLCPPINAGAGYSGELSPPERSPDGGVTQMLRFGVGGATSGFALTAPSCWLFSGYNFVGNTAGDVWAATGPITVNGFLLAPIDRAHESLSVSTLGDFTASSSSGGTTIYKILVPDGNGGWTPVGETDLGTSPFRFDYGTLGRGLLGHFGPTPDGPSIGNGRVTGGDIHVYDAEGSTIDVHLQLPSLFSSAPVPSPPPTGDLHYDLGASAPDSGGGGGGGGGGGTTGGGECTDNCITRPRPVPHFERRMADPPIRQQELQVGLNGHFHLDIPDLYLGALDIQHAFLDYDPDRSPDRGGLWSGGGVVQLGPVQVNAAPPPADMGFGVFGDGGFSYGGAQASFSPPVQVFPTVGLDSITARFGLDPTRFKGAVGLDVADVVKVDGGVIVVFANDAYPYTYQPDDIPGIDHLQTRAPLRSFAVGAGGQATLNVPVLGEVPLAHAYGMFIAPSYFEFGAGLHLALSIATIDAEAKGAFDTQRKLYDLDGQVHACADFPWPIEKACLGMHGHVSNLGIGACVDYAGWNPGVRYKWGGEFTPFLTGCDDGMGPITVVVRPAALRASSTLGFNTPRRAPSTSVIVKGAGAPPRIKLSGPHGEHVASGPDLSRGTNTRTILIAPMKRLHETVIGIKHPSTGHWTITPQSGSARITGIEQSNGLPPAKITAKVGGKGRHRTLSYRLRARAGQTVTFAEKAGHVFHVIGRAVATNATLHFNAANGPAGVRRIVAMISLSGTPEKTLRVASYRAPGPISASKPRHLRVARHTGRLVARWGRSANARAYAVTFVLSSKVRVSTTEPAGIRTVTMTKVNPELGATVTVVPIGPSGKPGPKATVRLGAVKPPAPIHGLKARRVKRGIAVSWKRASRATRYFARIVLTGVRRPRLAYVRQPHLLLRALKKGQRVTITVRGVSLTGRLGPRASVGYPKPRRVHAGLEVAR